MSRRRPNRVQNTYRQRPDVAGEDEFEIREISGIRRNHNGEVSEVLEIIRY